MELGRFLVEAVVLGGQSPNQLARTHPISRSWLFRLLARSPSQPGLTVQYRIRRDVVDATGTVTLRFMSQLRHIYVGRAHKREPVVLFIAGAHIRICTDDGLPIRELVMDPNRIYQRMTPPRLVANQLGQRSTQT